MPGELCTVLDSQGVIRNRNLELECSQHPTHGLHSNQQPPDSYCVLEGPNPLHTPHQLAIDFVVPAGVVLQHPWPPLLRPHRDRRADQHEARVRRAQRAAAAPRVPRVWHARTCRHARRQLDTRECAASGCAPAYGCRLGGGW
eukprot:358727-Chlamydomonas_euryale.AAC.16